MNVNKRLVAVIAAYNPELNRFKKGIANLFCQAKKIIIIDNNSKNILEIKKILKNKTSLLSLKKNIGLAAALNKGIELANNFDPEWILTLDQDTVLENNAIKKVFNSYEKLPTKIKNSIGIIALSNKHNQKKEEFNEISFCQTSGNLVKSKVFSKIKFREDFFIDQVDYEFDLRLRKHGYKIFEYNHKLIQHEVGNQNESKNYEEEFRLYYITRNSTYLLLNLEFPFLRYSIQIMFWYLRLLEVKKLRGITPALKSFFYGLSDGFCRKLGKSKRKF